MMLVSARRTRVACRLLAVCFAIRAAVAQDAAPDRSLSIGVLVALDYPAGLGDSLRTGPGIGVVVQLPFPASRFALRGDLMYQAFRDHEPACPFGGCLTRAPSRILSGTLDLVVFLASPSVRVSPYLIAGAAIYGLGDHGSVLRNSHPSSFGVQAGAGVQVRRDKAAIFAEVRYMSVAPGSVIPVTLGMRF